MTTYAASHLGLPTYRLASYFILELQSVSQRSGPTMLHLVHLRPDMEVEIEELFPTICSVLSRSLGILGGAFR